MLQSDCVTLGPWRSDDINELSDIMNELNQESIANRQNNLNNILTYKCSEFAGLFYLQFDKPLIYSQNLVNLSSK